MSQSETYWADHFKSYHTLLFQLEPSLILFPLIEMLSFLTSLYWAKSYSFQLPGRKQLPPLEVQIPTLGEDCMANKH